MIPGLFNQSPLREKLRESMEQKAKLRQSIIAARPNGEGASAEASGAHYNPDAPPGHWRP